MVYRTGSGLTVVTIANNLPLTVSIIWCLLNTLVFTLPVAYALVHNRSVVSAYSYLCMFLVAVCLALVAIACSGLGRDFGSFGTVSPSV